ncbi:hypothetical protein NM688_g3584 [Phlebia brevispora]|uniref:Uncharacterized protein n=1 Tax=Phlebia brevispora TaxID=194682 RepID=A0ACC1T5C3_9APHY|nr:hypothetical protein NM688_g3584 [Phlebia brevispora]
MFSFRRKSKKQPEQNRSARIRTSPSLPDLSTQGIQWPESLINISELPAIKLQAVQSQPVKLANGKPGGPISALYTAPPPSAYDNRRSTYSSRRKPSQKKNRNPVTFNLMVAGAQGTGKTSLLRLLLETAEISPTASEEQRAALYGFLRGPPKRTEDIQTVAVEICESKFDRITLTVIDTAGLDFQPGHELTLERQVSSITRYLDAQFADTLSEASRFSSGMALGMPIVRTLTYVCGRNPKSYARAKATSMCTYYPSKPRTDNASSGRPSDVSAVSADSLSQESGDDATEHSDDLTMSPVDISVIQRLSRKTNVLPIIARADSLTDEALATIKSVIRKNLAAAGLDFGVFDPPPTQTESSANDNGTKEANGNGNGHHTNGQEDDPEPEERQSRRIIKLRPSRNPFKFRNNSRSRSRLDLTEPSDEPTSVDNIDSESVASVRFSAQRVSRADMPALLPFALIAPQYRAHRRLRQVSQVSQARIVSDDRSVNTHAGAVPGSPTDDSHGPGSDHLSPVSTHAKQLPFSDGPPADLRGVFTRRYRWGTIDVLAPEHCDFATLRTAVLSTHMKMLKIRTREVLYERYRTEKLLARRATRNISQDETRRMFAEIGL